MKTNKKSYLRIGLLLIGIIAIAAVILIVNMNQQVNEQEEVDEKETTVDSEVTEDEKEKELTQEENGNSDAVQKEETSPEKQSAEHQEKKEQTQHKKGTKEHNGYIEGQQLPSKPTYIQGVLIANKKYPLPKDFAPGESKEARAAFEKMAQDAKKQGFELVAFSTYRSYEYQATLYNSYVARDGKEKADRYSARPGYSEHQTGLAFDIGEKGREDLWLEEAFGESPAGKWLAENAHKYGFILRYPKGKENITGYMYEAWHFRYLGVELATKVKESGLTLEEYLGIN